MSTARLMTIATCAMLIACATGRGQGGAVAGAGEPGVQVVIPGVEQLHYGQGTGKGNLASSGFLAPIVAALHAKGEPISYDYLMGASGAAFRIFDGFSLYSWDTMIGYDHFDGAQSACPYGLETRQFAMGQPAEKAKCYATIRDSIDRGLPVIAFNLQDDWIYGLIVGYVKNSDRLICRTYSRAPGYVTVDAYRWNYIWVLTQQRRNMDTAGIERTAVARAIELARTPKFGKMASGFAAWDRWMADIKAFDAIAKPEERAKQIQEYIFCVGRLLNARAAAAHYLQDTARHYPAPVAQHLLSAAGDYSQIADVLQRLYDELPDKFEVTSPWTARDRDTQIATLTRCKRLEEDAVEELVIALPQMKPI